MSRRRIALGATALLGLLASACGSKAASPTTTTTLVKTPPDEVALVTEIGTGAALGSGTALYGVDLTGGPGGPTKSFDVGTFPDAVAITPNHKLALVANYESNDVTPVDLVTGKAGKSIPAGDGPAGIAIAPNGKTAYVTDAGTAPIGDTVTPIDLKTMKAMTPIKVGDGPQGIAISPDGSTAWVTDAGAVVSGQTGAIGDTVTPINLLTNTAGSPVTVGNAPIAVAVSPDGSTAWVANSSSGSVTPITTANNQPGTPVAVDGSPQALAVSPDGSTVWVADTGSTTATNNLTPIATSTGTAGTPVTLDKGPTSLAITPNGLTAWVVASGAGVLEPVDLSSHAALSTGAIKVPGGPYAIALVAEQHTAALVTLHAPTKINKKH